MGSAYRPTQASGRSKRRKSHHVGRTILIVVLVLIALAGVEGFFLYGSYQKVKAYASDATSSLSTIKDAVKSDDTTALQSAASNVNVDAHGIQNELNSPAWVIASVAPVVGQDVRSARTLGDVLVDLSDNALSPIATNAADLNLTNLLSDGAINVDALQNMASVVSQAQPVVSRSAQAVDALPTETRIAKVGELVSKARASLDSASSALEKANTILPYLPTMLGSGGQTKTYLVLAQTNSEIHATGGFPGSVGIMRVTDGHIEMGDFSSIYDYLPVRTNGTIGATEEERQVFGSRVDLHPCDTNYIPDFQRVGQILQQAWQQDQGATVDGVIATDPVFVQWLVGLTGNVTASDGTVVTGDNAAKVLLSDAYWKYGAKSDFFFTDVASKAMSSILANLGNADVTKLIDVLNKAVDQHRCLAWNADDSCEAAIVAMGASGAITNDATKPELGVYLNDSSGAKLGWYLSCDTTVGEGTKNADGTTSYQVTTVVRNNVQKSEVSSLPDYVQTHQDWAARSGADLQLWLYLVAPAGGAISNVQADGYFPGISFGFGDPAGTTTMVETSFEGHDVWYGGTQVNAEGSTTVTYTVTVPAEASGAELAVRTTPTAQEVAGWQ